jgi:hypothetical protein
MLRPSPTSLYVRLLPALCLLATCFANFGLTLDDLRRSPDLTPATFASHFHNFEFAFRREVQRPEAFLASKSGDCDDFSTLAAAVLREKGYTPRLISIRMPGVTHVVCYIEETGAYLDYNFRNSSGALVRSGSSVAEIAESVARSYNLKWNSASEFTFDSGVKRLVHTVVEPSRTPTGTPNILASLFR